MLSAPSARSARRSRALTTDLALFVVGAVVATVVFNGSTRATPGGRGAGGGGGGGKSASRVGIGDADVDPHDAAPGADGPRPERHRATWSDVEGGAWRLVSRVATASPDGARGARGGRGEANKDDDGSGSDVEANVAESDRQDIGGAEDGGDGRADSGPDSEWTSTRAAADAAIARDAAIPTPSSFSADASSSGGIEGSTRNARAMEMMRGGGDERAEGGEAGGADDEAARMRGKRGMEGVERGSAADRDGDGGPSPKRAILRPNQASSQPPSLSPKDSARIACRATLKASFADLRPKKGLGPPSNASAAWRAMVGLTPLIQRLKHASLLPPALDAQLSKRSPRRSR